MPTHSHKADPAACKLCARLTKKAGEPTKCKWHGGGGVKKGAGKKKPKTERATGGGTRRPPPPAPVAAVASNGKFAAHITGLKQAVAAGLLAQAELDGYKASLA